MNKYASPVNHWAFGWMFNIMGIWAGEGKVQHKKQSFEDISMLESNLHTINDVKIPKKGMTLTAIAVCGFPLLPRNSAVLLPSRARRQHQVEKLELQPHA